MTAGLDTHVRCGGGPRWPAVFPESRAVARALVVMAWPFRRSRNAERLEG